MKKTVFLMILFGCLSLDAIQAQEPDRSGEQPEWTERFDKRFMGREPLLESIAPDVSAFDEKGEAFSLSDSRGQYTVITFGCLT